MAVRIPGITSITWAWGLGGSWELLGWFKLGGLLAGLVLGGGSWGGFDGLTFRLLLGGVGVGFERVCVGLELNCVLV